MRIVFLGDSITVGGGASSYDKCYVSQLGKLLGAETLNYGVSGTRIARQKFIIDSGTLVNYDFNLRAELLPDTADYVIVFGGTNDFGHGCAPLGKESDTSVYTFFGACNTLFEKLIKKYGKEKILVIQILPRFNQGENGDSLLLKNGLIASFEQYKNILKQSSINHGLKIVDFSDKFPVGNKCEPSELFTDGLHPNDKGHALLAELIYNEIKK